MEIVLIAGIGLLLSTTLTGLSLLIDQAQINRLEQRQFYLDKASGGLENG